MSTLIQQAVVLEMTSYPGKYVLRSNGRSASYTPDKSKAKRWPSEQMALDWVDEHAWSPSWVKAIRASDDD